MEKAETHTLPAEFFFYRSIRLKLKVWWDWQKKFVDVDGWPFLLVFSNFRRKPPTLNDYQCKHFCIKNSQYNYCRLLRELIDFCRLNMGHNIVHIQMKYTVQQKKIKIFWLVHCRTIKSIIPIHFLWYMCKKMDQHLGPLGLVQTKDYYHELFHHYC